MKEIPLTRGKVALVDDDDFERLARFRWQATPGRNGNWYATRVVSRREGNGKRTSVSLHRSILKAPRGIEVDHRNRNGLDCQKHNLRLATRSQNQANSTRRKQGGGYKGVHLSPAGHWVAIVQFQKQRFYLGTSATPDAAARVYDAKAAELHGEFACLNFPEGNPMSKEVKDNQCEQEENSSSVTLWKAPKGTQKVSGYGRQNTRTFRQV